MIQKIRKPLLMTVATELKKTASKSSRKRPCPRWKMRWKEEKRILMVKFHALKSLLDLGTYLRRFELPKDKNYILEEARKKIDWRP
jgi:hypothetical protein